MQEFKKITASIFYIFLCFSWIVVRLFRCSGPVIDRGMPIPRASIYLSFSRTCRSADPATPSAEELQAQQRPTATPWAAGTAWHSSGTFTGSPLLKHVEKALFPSGRADTLQMQYPFPPISTIRYHQEGEFAFPTSSNENSPKSLQSTGASLTGGKVFATAAGASGIGFGKGRLIL